MIGHNVLLNLKEGTTEKQLEDLRSSMIKLSREIQGVISINFGENISPENLDKGFTYRFFIVFKSYSDFENYLPHPGHEEVRDKYILPIIDDALVFDYEY